MDCSLPVSSVHGISQARIMEQVAISFSRGSSWPRNLSFLVTLLEANKATQRRWSIIFPKHCLLQCRKMKSASEVAQLYPTLWPHGLQPTRLLHPWDFPEKNTGVGCHFLLQGIFPTQGSNPGLLHCRQTLYHLSHQVSPKKVWISTSTKFYHCQSVQRPLWKCYCTNSPLREVKFCVLQWA